LETRTSSVWGTPDKLKGSRVEEGERSERVGVLPFGQKNTDDLIVQKGGFWENLGGGS